MAKFLPIKAKGFFAHTMEKQGFSYRRMGSLPSLDKKGHSSKRSIQWKESYNSKIFFNTSKQKIQFDDGNGRTLFANDHKTIKSIERRKKDLWYKINLYCIKCLNLIKNINIKIKHKIDGKINLCSRLIYCGFKMF